MCSAFINQILTLSQYFDYNKKRLFIPLFYQSLILPLDLPSLLSDLCRCSVGYLQICQSATFLSALSSFCISYSFEQDRLSIIHQIRLQFRFLLLHFLSSSNVGALHCKFSKGPQHQENLSDSANEQVDSSLEAMECLTTSVKTNTTSSNRISKCNPSPVVKVIYHYKRAKEFY